MFCGEALAAKYGPSNHFVIKEAVCAAFNPDTHSTGSQEEVARLGDRYRMCQSISQISKSEAPSKFYTLLQERFGVCRSQADANMFNERMTFMKLFYAKNAMEWTIEDLGTFGVYAINCKANIQDIGEPDLPKMTALATDALDMMERTLAPAIRTTNLQREKLEEMRAAGEARLREKVERDRDFAGQGYTRMDLDEIKLDARKYLGRKIVTNGYMYMVRNDSGMIASDRRDTNFIGVDISKASREFREEALSNCSREFRQCQIEVKGTLDTHGELIVIRAD